MPLVNAHGTSVTYTITSVTKSTKDANSSAYTMQFSIDPSTGLITGTTEDEYHTEIYIISGTVCNA